MHICVIGAGLSGATAARILAERGHGVVVLDKDSIVGGLCQTQLDPSGCRYEHYGCHAFHTDKDEVWNFVNRFASFSDYIHKKGILIGDTCFSYPLQMSELKTLLSYSTFYKIEQELREIKSNISTCNNFEETVIGMVGPTLYKLFVKNYTATQWGIDPKEMLADWAPNRIEIRNDDDIRLFRNEKQGIPIQGYTSLVNEMLNHSNITYVPNYKVDSINIYRIKEQHDIVICSAPVDDILHGNPSLPYRGGFFVYDWELDAKDIYWENDKFGTINYSKGRVLRKMNFGIIHQLGNSEGTVAFQYGDGSGRLYPILTKESKMRFHYLLNEAIIEDIIPFGRLGSFTYLDMDDAIYTAMQVVDLVEDWKSLLPWKKGSEWLKIFGGY